MAKALFFTQLEQSLHFHGISGMPSSETFYYNEQKPSSAEFLYAHAGGAITYPSPVHFRLSGFPYTVLAYVTEGKIKLKNHENEFTCPVGTLLIGKPNAEMSFHTEQTPFSYQLYFLSGANLSPYFSALYPDGEEHEVFTTQSVHGDYILQTMRQADHFFIRCVCKFLLLYS